MVEPRPTKGAPRAELEELLAEVRRNLTARDEAPGGAWIDSAVRDLADGSRPGFYLSDGQGSGLAFYSARGPLAFGHVHVSAGPEATERGVALADRLLDSLPPSVRSADLGFTGLGEGEERELVRRLSRRDRSTVIARQAMERTLAAEDSVHPAEPPPPVRRLGVEEVTTEALADLDRRGFQGSIDALLVGESPEDYRRSIAAMTGDELGRFLNEASCALVTYAPVRLVGALLTAEKSPRRAVFLDLVVDPAQRRAGLGRFLLGWGLRALWSLGFESVRLWVSVENSAALALYKRFGFRSVASATIYRWDRPDSSGQPQRIR